MRGRGRRGGFARLVLAAVVLGAPASAAAAPEDEVLVRYRDGSDAGERAHVRAAAQTKLARRLPLARLELVRAQSGESARAAAARLERDPHVLYAEPNRRGTPDRTPTDPRFGEQWAPRMISAPPAWDLTTGSADVVVAVVDGGVEVDHPELQPNLWRNPGESGGGREANRVDDDGNGFVDDWQGWNFYDNDNFLFDGSGHGTAAAGVIGAAADNGLGISGVSPRVRIMPIDGSGSTATAVQAFTYARRMGARVVSASFNLGGYSQAVEDAINASPDTLFVFSAGNEGVDADTADFRYPCRSAAPNAICVGATNQSDQMVGWSNYGAHTVDLAAPGTDILTLRPLNRQLLDERFSDDLAGRWVTGGTGNTWAREPWGSSGDWVLSDSPGTWYAPDSDSWAALANPVDLSGAHDCNASYWSQNTLASGDVLRFEASDDGGATWTTLATNGSSPVDLAAYDGKPVWFRFRLTSDGSGEADGTLIHSLYVSCLHPRFRGDEFTYASGTSFAAPHVSAAAALVLSHNPGATTAEVRDALMANGDPLPSLAGRTVSGRRLNVLRALTGPVVDTPTQSGVDASAPRCRIMPRRHQRLGRLHRRGYRVDVRCDEAARLSVRLSRGRTMLARTHANLATPGMRHLALKVSRRNVRALRRHRTPRLGIELHATDAAGNTTRLKRHQRLRR